jgi:RNA polymerase sigma-70 factor (ECF subfamily)
MLPQAADSGAAAFTAAFQATLAPNSPVEVHASTMLRTPEQDAANEATLMLVRLCVAGDASAWQQLVTGHHRRIYAICYRFTNNADDADDLTQEVFLKVYRSLGSFDTARGSFQIWVTTVTRNLLVDHYRRSRLERASESLDVPFDGDHDGATLADRLADRRPAQDSHVAALELKARIAAALTHLSPELREAVILRDLQDLDYKEIAAVLGVPEGTVKSRISRGRTELARILKPTDDALVKNVLPISKIVATSAAATHTPAKGQVL